MSMHIIHTHTHTHTHTCMAKNVFQFTTKVPLRLSLYWYEVKYNQEAQTVDVTEDRTLYAASCLIKWQLQHNEGRKNVATMTITKWQLTDKVDDNIKLGIMVDSKLVTFSCKHNVGNYLPDCMMLHLRRIIFIHQIVMDKILLWNL
jgi:hypothetical protein